MLYLNLPARKESDEMEKYLAKNTVPLFSVFSKVFFYRCAKKALSCS